MSMIDRTFDMELVREIITHPKIYDHVSDDFSPAPEDFIPIDPDSVYYLTPIHNGTVMGVFFVHSHNGICYEVHTCILPEYHGALALKAAKDLIKWVFEETPCMKLITNVPSFNPLAYRFALKAGMVKEGVNTKSFQKNGVIYDQTVLGIVKE
ncbi:MAG: GNAT family N-acetyltransferase [Phycisphaerales bacterium]|nr:GNAT family N-acetyltransferase [Phycisphaerales bacterium]